MKEDVKKIVEKIIRDQKSFSDSLKEMFDTTDSENAYGRVEKQAGPIFILGGADAEMQRIEDILERHNVPYTYATVGSGRVHPGNAYKATGPLVPEYDTTVFVECAVPVAGGVNVVVIDHHRPGDPGYGAPPEKFWEASSIGQVCNYLGIAPDEEDLIVAATDHCLSHAYAGRCPGVDPTRVAEFRIKSKAGFLGKGVDEINADIEAAIQQLKSASQIGPFKDMRGSVVPELPEAASIAGEKYIAQVTDRAGAEKVVVGGSTEPQDVEYFMKEIGPEMGLTGIYGDPARGFAGGYVA